MKGNISFSLRGYQGIVFGLRQVARPFLRENLARSLYQGAGGIECRLPHAGQIDPAV